MIPVSSWLCESLSTYNLYLIGPTILERAEKEEVRIETVTDKSDGLDVQVQTESGPSDLTKLEPTA